MYWLRGPFSTWRARTAVNQASLVFKTIAKVDQEALNVRCLDCAFSAFLRGILYVVEISYYCTCKLQSCADAGCGAKRILVAK